MSDYSSHRSSSSKRDKYSSYDDRRSRERRSKDDRDSGYDRGRPRSRSRSRPRHSGNDGSSSTYRSSHSKRKRSYERDYDASRYGEHSRHDYNDKYDRDSDKDRLRDRDQRDRDRERDRDRDRDRERDRERERDRGRDRDSDRHYSSSRRSNSKYEGEQGPDDTEKAASSSTRKSFRSHSREHRERNSRQDNGSRSLAASATATSFDTDSLPKAPAAYFQQQPHHRPSWNYDTSAYSQSNTTAWTGNTDVYSASAEAYNQQYASYYGDPNEYYRDSYNQQIYHSADGVPPPPPPPFPPAQADKDSMSIPPPPPPQPMPTWSRYSYDGLPTGPAADRINTVAPNESQANVREQSDACHTLGVDNISPNINLNVLKNIGYPVKASDEPTEKYEKIGQVGEGTYGKVYKAKSKVTGELVALKRIRMESEKEGFPITAMREIKLLQKLRHKRIVQLSEIMVSKGSVYMVLEYMDHDLTGVLGHPEFRFEPAQAKSLIKQMLEGVAFLHHMGVLHRDIKGSNLLLNKKGELKIADFGLARIFQKRRTHDYTNRVITLWYRPPELLLGATAYGPAVDMWSVGCIMLEFFTGKPVFNGSDEISQLEIIYKIMGTPDEKIWPTVVDLPWWELMRPKEPLPAKFRELFASLMSDGALELLEALLALDPSKRPSASDALKFPYFVAESPDTSSPANLLDIAGDWHEYESKRKRKSGTSAALNGNGDVKKASVADKR